MSLAALKAELDANFIKYKSKTKNAALTSLLVETIEARSKIPRLNEDVQGYIVSFLSGFDSLHMVTKLARGFRFKAKPRFDAMLKRTDADIKQLRRRSVRILRRRGRFTVTLVFGTRRR
ncbi:hypothetical protein TrVE_jg13785 [Triparma verrucosa]|uniref:Uncharacterized protein n=1 Tax=Triparma verrucosa TaxID=1606542 RepID=A0A9W7CBA7_9STRA|nr:hypothetical protein TrVE_jg13785 [Triparma verrucosa]